MHMQQLFPAPIDETQGVVSMGAFFFSLSLFVTHHISRIPEHGWLLILVGPGSDSQLHTDIICKDAGVHLHKLRLL
jgi:hypothetical protein